MEESNDGLNVWDTVASDARAEFSPTSDCVAEGSIQIVLDGRAIPTDLAAFCLAEMRTLSEMLVTATKL
jgi:hypothetical protein